MSVASFEQVVSASELVLILRAIGGEDGSGLLAVQGEEDLVSLTFRQGDIVAADAMNRSMEEGLCEVLAQMGVLPPAEFREIVDSSDDISALGSEKLLAAGRPEKRLVLEAVREQTFRQSLQLLRWQDGHLQWVADGESPFQSGVVPLTVGELLIRSIEELGAAGPLGPQAAEFSCDYVPSADAEGRFRERRPDDPFVEGDSQAVHLLTTHERETFRRLQGGATIEELLSGRSRQQWQTKAALHYLWSCGLAQRKFKDSGVLARPALESELEESGAMQQLSIEQAAVTAGELRPKPSEEPLVTPLPREASDSLLSMGEDDDLASLLKETPAGLDESLSELASNATAEPTSEPPREASSGEALASLDDLESLGSLDTLSSLESVDEPLDLPIEGNSFDSRSDDSSRDLFSSSRRDDAVSGVGSGPISIGDMLVREELDGELGEHQVAASAGNLDHIAGLLNVWGVRFLAMVLVALLLRQWLGTSDRHEPLSVLVAGEDLQALAEHSDWRLAEAKIARALRVYHLIYGVYPDDLEVLVDLDLCSEGDLRGPNARRLSYQIEGDGYRLESASGPDARRSTSLTSQRSDSVVGDFFLNPKYIRQARESSGTPVVMLN